MPKNLVVVVLVGMVVTAIVLVFLPQVMAADSP